MGWEEENELRKNQGGNTLGWRVGKTTVVLTQCCG
jgi:hypothetical protein